MPTLNEEKRKPSKREMTPDEIVGLLWSDRQFRCPPHLKQTRCTLRLEIRIVESQPLSSLRLLVEQQKDAV